MQEKKKLSIKEIVDIVSVYPSRIYDCRSKYNKYGKKAHLLIQI